MNLFTLRQALAGTAACVAVTAMIVANASWQASTNDDIARALPSIAALPSLATPVSPPPPSVARSEVAGESETPSARPQTASRRSRSAPALTSLAMLPAAPDALASPQFSTAQTDYAAAKRAARLARQRAWVQTMRERTEQAEANAASHQWQVEDRIRVQRMRARTARAEAREAYLLRQAGYRPG